MLVVRAVAAADLNGLMALAKKVGPGMTTLKPDSSILRSRIDLACASFAGTVAAEECDYLFVMENLITTEVVGVCAIKAAVGLRQPFYNFRIGTLVHSSVELGIFSPMETLYLSSDLTGAAELCSLYLHPDYRTAANGKLLSKSRFLFIAQFAERFPQTIIAEMRGFLREDGVSPFWENLGRHFFHMDFKRADDLCSQGKKSFISELMPRHPLYVAYLPREAQEVIGMVHVDTEPARHLLQQEGMFHAGYIDIFDAGPVLQARISDLRANRESLVGVVRHCDAALEQGVSSMIATTAMDKFRVILAEQVAGLDVALTPPQAEALGCQPGQRVRTMSLKAGARAHA
ncbi:MAG: arginine N-succinyltransferase [Pseudomonadota bacterium]